VVGILGLFAGFSSSQKLSLVSERHATMAHIAEQEIEQLEGVSYSSLELTTTPSHSTDPTNPDYYITNGASTVLQYDRTNPAATESVVVDATNGAVQHFHTQTQGTTSYNVYDYITWTQDPKCSPGCAGTQNYKRLTVAVTVASGLQPTPVWSSSKIADPAAEPVQGIQNGLANNPILSGSTHCLNGSGQTIECVNGVANGNPVMLYLHDSPPTTLQSGSGPGNFQNVTSTAIPAASHATNATVQAIDTQQCPLSLSGGQLGNTSGCPVPDQMDSNPPPNNSGGVAPQLYNYTTDVTGTSGTGGTSGCTSNCPGATLLPCVTNCVNQGGTSGCGSSCQTTYGGGGTGGGTGSTTDCSNQNWSNGLVNVQSHMWVSSPVTANTTLTGDAALTMFSQLAGTASAVVSFCIELYDIPPTNGVLGSLADIFLTGSQPNAIGGAAYVPPTDQTSGSNWPSTSTQTSFAFHFTSTPTTVYVLPDNHRLGVRVSFKVNVHAALDLLYDNPNYPAGLQVNVQ
jgi:hypothetical protein